MNTSFSSVNALATLLLLMGLLLFNNGLAAWQSSQQVYSRYFQNTEAAVQRSASSIQQEYRQVMIRNALNIACSLFLIWLGLQVLFKKRWACHFFFSVRQVAQFSLLFLPLATLLLSSNRPLMDSLAAIYQPIVQEIIQQEYGQASNKSPVVLDSEAMRMALQVALFFLAFLGMGIAGLLLRLSSRCLAKEVQKALLEHSPYAGRFSRFILCLPMKLLLVLLLSAYGMAKQLLEILSASLVSLVELELLMFRFGAFVCFALALLQLTNRNVQYSGNPLLKFQLLKKALFFCGLAYCIQLLQHSLGVGSVEDGLTTLSTQRNSALLLAQSAIKGAVSQMQILSDVLVLLMLGFLYYFLKRAISNIVQSLEGFQSLQGCQSSSTDLEQAEGQKQQDDET